jgi:release factor glutamine methyltransferase
MGGRQNFRRRPIRPRRKVKLTKLRIQEALRKYHKIEIELLLAHVLRKPKEFLYLFPEHELTRIQHNKLTRMAQRRLRGEPVAYILGGKDFMGLRFKVNRNVLIPRPETELIIERLKDLRLKDFKKPIRILDVGTGSGCIAVSIAREMQNIECKMQITASDISEKALAVARQNAKAHKVNIKFVKSDLLKNIKDDFDVIIANLPYVPNGDLRLLISSFVRLRRTSADKKDLRFEPKSAIFAKGKGLYLIRRLLEQIVTLKNKPKLVYLEFDPRQKPELDKLIKKFLPGSKTKFYKDYNNFWRYAEISS